MVIAAVDNALWDLKARLLQSPLFLLLGGARTHVPVYGSGGFTSYSISDLEAQPRNCPGGIAFLLPAGIRRRERPGSHQVMSASDAVSQPAGQQQGAMPELEDSLVRWRPCADTLYVSQSNTVLATGRDGFVHKGSADGLFVHETRLLSRSRSRLTRHRI